LGTPGRYGNGMREPTLVFAKEREGEAELVVNLGVF
jgi:hypothetical protein